MASSNKKYFFTSNLLKWFAGNDRPLPWKGIKNPYLIWLSEIILQQTRVEQGLPYFEQFKKSYPTIQDLANAPEDEVMKLWEGLGYYSRARNMHFTAKYIANDLKGTFPKDYKSILKLKGVGPYTAAAIVSFAYNLPHAVVDGNVYRVLSRFFGIHTPTDTTAGKKEFATLAQELLDKQQAAIYNQAIMDFGATVCTPKNPSCLNCPLQAKCIAFAKGLIATLPIKSKRITRKVRYFNYLILNYKDQVAIQKRLKKDIWQNLYEFPLVELPQPIKSKILFLQQEKTLSLLPSNTSYSIKKISKPYKQTLTHQIIVATFWEFELSSSPQNLRKKFVIHPRNNLQKFAFPKIIDLYLQDNSLYLELL